MQAKLLQSILTIAMVAGCSAAPLETPSDTSDIAQTTDALGTPIPASFYAAKAGGPPAGYVSVPGGLQVAKQCVQVLKPGEKQLKRPPCPIPPIKGKTVKQTMPVEPGALMDDGASLVGEDSLAPPFPAVTFDEVPGSWVAATATEYHSLPNYGWISQYNVTKFRSRFTVPPGPTAGDQGQLIYLHSGAEKWGGNYPAMTSLYAVAGAFLQYGWNGMWGDWHWTMFTYAHDPSGNWTFRGPIYDVAGSLTFEGTSSHVADPYWGSVTRWHLTINGSLLPLDFNYPDPWDFNFVTEALECFNNCSAKNLYPSGPQGNTITPFSIWTNFWTQPHGCTPGDNGYPAPPWWCEDAATNPKWNHLGNGGTIPDYKWISTNTPTSGQLGYPTLQRFAIVPR